MIKHKLMLCDNAGDNAIDTTTNDDNNDHEFNDVLPTTTPNAKTTSVLAMALKMKQTSIFCKILPSIAP